MDNITSKECTEVEIKVPWGHISGKWWGPQNIRPILAMHGWQDNAGTFDTLIPLLPPNVAVLAIDLPGHGFSSHIPDGQMYHGFLDDVIVVRMVMKEYNWDKVSILGHSMGSIIGFITAAIYPGLVDLLIGIDAYMPSSIVYLHYPYVMQKVYDLSSKADERHRNTSEPPSYSYEECIDKLHEGTINSIDRDKCSYILNRNIRKSTKYPDKYYFARDNRLKSPAIGVWHHKMYSDLLSNIRCPVLYIRALGSPLANKQDEFDEHMRILKESSSNFQYYDVEGRHHVHLNEPNKVSVLINEFLKEHEGVLACGKAKL